MNRTKHRGKKNRIKRTLRKKKIGGNSTQNKSNPCLTSNITTKFSDRTGRYDTYIKEAYTKYEDFSKINNPSNDQTNKYHTAVRDLVKTIKLNHCDKDIEEILQWIDARFEGQILPSLYDFHKELTGRSHNGEERRRKLYEPIMANLMKYNTRELSNALNELSLNPNAKLTPYNNTIAVLKQDHTPEFLNGLQTYIKEQYPNGMTTKVKLIYDALSS